MTAQPAGRKRLRRGSLSRDVIVETALRILDEDGVDALTFNRLGAELSAASTSVYRHFASRDQIIVAIADELDRISLEGYEPHDDWRESLRDLALRAWHTAESHPAAASMAMTRTTRGIHELRAVDAVLEAVHRAGWEGSEAVMHYATFTTSVLFSSAHYAARLLNEAAEGREGWVQEYHPAHATAAHRPSSSPNTWLISGAVVKSANGSRAA